MNKPSFLCLLMALLANPIVAQQNLQQSMQQRAWALINQMTLDEKCSQLMNASPGIERLGILPYDWWNEGLHGVGRTGRATVYPEPIGLGATFHPELVEQIGDAVSTEGRAKFAIAQRLGNYGRYAGLTYWSPNVNIFRDPRWGRGMETYGEDPLLTGLMGTSYVHGLQGRDPFYLKAGACAKHYAVHSGPEATRHTADIHPSKRDLFETYLPAFRMLVEDGQVEVVMAAYNAVYGEACPASSYLLTDILRHKWGFNGHIVSDCGAVDDIYQGHGNANDAAAASAAAIKAGLNVECGHTFDALQEAVQRGLLTEEDLNNALLPLIMTRLKLGIIGDNEGCPYNHYDEDVICCEKHTRLAYQAALESMVLLKNDNHTLPLSKEVKSIFVTGEGATDAFSLMGNYYGISPRYSTILQGIVSKVSNGTSVNFRPGCMTITPEQNDINWAIGECAGAEYSIVVLGNNGNTEGEEGEAIGSSTRGDRETLTLPESQMHFLRRVKQSGTRHLIVILTGGSPIDMREICALADAVVMCWYPGQEGGDALGDLLFGNANFSGRLPITFPEDINKLPAFDDYSMQGRTYKYMTDNIYFPFGFGLTYSAVSYEKAELVGKVDKTSGAIVRFTLRNEGKMAVEEVAQIYEQAPGAGATAPLSQLVAFTRVALQPGEEKTVEVSIPANRLMVVDADGELRWRKGEHTLVVSAAAPSTRSCQLGVAEASASFRMK